MRCGSRTVPRRAAALAVVLSLALAAPSRASDAPEPRPQQSPLALAAAAHAERAELSQALQSAPEPAVVQESAKPFFKTRRGVVTAILMAAGLGWVIYSKSNEGVTSPAND